MSSPAFVQDQPRSLGVPIAIALIVLVLAGVGYSFSMRQGKMEITAAHTAVIPTTTVYKSDSIVLAAPDTEIVLFVAPTLTATNKTRIPVTLNDFALTLTDRQDAQLTAHPMTPAEIDSAEQSFPELRPALSGALLRDERELASGATLSGTLLFSLRVTKAQWDDRKSAVVHVGLYNQPEIAVPLTH